MASDSDASLSSSDESEAVGQQEPFVRSSQSKKTRGKIPKKIHKAEREKKKRDHLNVLFVNLVDTLESDQQFSGKASILCNAIRLLRDLLNQVDSLKKENMALLSESNDVSSEKNELKEENASLEAQIEELKSQVQERNHSGSAWKLDNLQLQHDIPSTSKEDCLILPAGGNVSQPAPVLGPLLVVPLHHHDLQLYQEPDTSAPASTLQSNLSRPLARYPSSSDSWPSQILNDSREATF
ncbi:hypothetical protein NMG60_11028414 [Bertholletia excelsa]